MQLGLEILSTSMIWFCFVGKGGYANVWGEYMKNRWNWVNPKHMERLLDYLKGKETRMDNFLGTA